MERLIKRCMALVVFVIGMMTLLTPMASAHAAPRDRNPPPIQSPSSYHQTIQGWVNAKATPYKKGVYCQNAGDRLLGGFAGFVPYKNAKSVSYVRDEMNGKEGAKLTFTATGRVFYQATIVCRAVESSPEGSFHSLILK